MTQSAHFHVEALSYCVFDMDEFYVNSRCLYGHFRCEDRKFHAVDYLRWDGLGFEGDDAYTGPFRTVEFALGKSGDPSYTMSKFDFSCDVYRSLTDDGVSKTIRPSAGKCFRLVDEGGFLARIEEVEMDAGEDVVVDSRGKSIDLSTSYLDQLKEEFPWLSSQE